MRLVLGYVRGVDRLPRQARRLGLVQRSALVLDTYRPDSPDALLDAALYAALVVAVARAVAATASWARLEGGGVLDVSAPGAALVALEAIPEVERVPFPKVEYRSGAAIVALALHEPYANVGGPEPYHDSHTIAVYTAADRFKELEEEVARAVQRSAGESLEVIHGEPSPVGGGFFETLGAKVASIFGLSAWWTSRSGGPRARRS
jgi:hypothetical protein